MNYRADIDGLRAIAVLSVLGYHLGASQLPGGFIGVDVFFVISGYLIGSMLMADLRDNRFSFVEFLSRRIRRLWPALFVMLMTVWVIGAFWAYPVRFEQLSRELVASALSVSNFYFWLTTGYFDAPADSRPLLHTWSLAIEEQFYFLLPLFLLATYKLRDRVPMTVMVGILACASFAFSMIGVHLGHSSAFYLLHSRAWELLLGVLIALGVRPALSSPLSRNAVGLAGLGATVSLPFLMSEALPFPGAAALLPCGAAAMVLVAGASGDNLASRLLAWRPLVVIGLMSYSLYLWHWPIIVFAKSALNVTVLTWELKLILGTLSLGIALLSWRCVERPWRRRDLLRVEVASRAMLGTLALVGVCCAVLLTRGAEWRFEPEVVRVAGYLERPGGPEIENSPCFFLYHDEFRPDQAQACTRIEPGRANVLVVGDSHGEHLVHGLKRSLSDVHISQLHLSSCRPLLPNREHRRENCRGMVRFVFGEYLETSPPDLVILAGRWVDSDLPALELTLDWLIERGIPTMIAGRIAEYSQPLPALLAMSLRTNDGAYARRHLSEDPARVNGRIEILARAKNVDYASIFRSVCPASDCTEQTRAGVPMQWDYGHLTREGSELVARRLVDSGVFCAVLGEQSRTACPA